MLSHGITDGQTRTAILDYIRLGLRFNSDTIDSFYGDWLTEISDAMCPGDNEEVFVKAVYQLIKRFGAQTVAALERFARCANVTKKLVSGSLLHIIQQQEYLKNESDRFADRLASKLQRAIPAMFANNRPSMRTISMTKSMVYSMQRQRNTDGNSRQHNLPSQR